MPAAARRCACSHEVEDVGELIYADLETAERRVDPSDPDACPWADPFVVCLDNDQLDGSGLVVPDERR